MFKYSFSIIVIFLFSTSMLLSKSELVATVLDNETHEGIKYCIITSDKSVETFLTNPEGTFRIPGISDDDTLTFSAIGFVPVRKSVADVRSSDSILLSQYFENFHKQKPNYSNSELFAFIKNASLKLGRKAALNSRAMLEFSSNGNNKELEFSTFYYNVLVQGSKVLDMDLKNGRACLASGKYGINNLYPSIVLLRQSPVKNSDFFPSSPLQPSMGEGGENIWNFEPGHKSFGEHIFHIKFTPKLNNEAELFSGEIWIDTISNDIQKISLFINNADKHPFSVKPGDIIKSVDIELHYHFAKLVEESKLIYIDFKYSFNYNTKKGAPSDKERIVNYGLMHFYNYDQPFFIPRFKARESYDDYLKAGMTPYDKAFWNNTNGLLLTSRQTKKISTIAKNGIIYNYQLPQKEAFSPESIFEENNIVWSSDRYLDLDANASPGAIRADLSVYIYLDINTYNDTNFYQSYTILNQSNTQYNLLNNRQNLVFQNIYFDLCEIVRLNLEEKISLLDNVSDIGKVHDAAMIDLESITGKFKQETRIGKDIDQLKKWNDLVLARTGVDNFKVFGLKYKPKKKKR